MVVKEKVRDFWEIKGKESHLWLHEGQKRAWDSEKRWVLMLAGSQGGKTVFGPQWLNREIKATYDQNDSDNDYLAVTATFPLLDNKMLPELKKCFETYLKIATYSESRKVFYSNDRYHGAEAWRIILGSAVNPDALEAATAKAAWLDECGQMSFKRNAWDAVRRRLSIYEGRSLFTTTLYGFGWLKTDFYDPAKEGDPDIDIIQFASTINPRFPKKEFEERRAKMPPWKFAMFYLGEYEKPAGLIYDSFNEETCRIKRFPMHDDWPCYVGHDFGGVNPAAMLYRIDPSTGYIYAWQEYRPWEGRSTYEHVQAFKEIVEGLHVLKRAGGSHQEDEIRQGYTSHGWPIQEPKIREVEAQIDRVYALHKLNKLFVFDDLYNYLSEKGTYSRKLDDNYAPTEKIEDKSSYHLMDAERYILSDFTPETIGSGRPVTRRSSFSF